MKRNTKIRSFTLEQEGNSTDIQAVDMPDAQESASACYGSGQQTDLPSHCLQNSAQKLLLPQELSARINELKTLSAILTGKSSQEQRVMNFEARKNKYCDNSNKRSVLFTGPSQIRGLNSRELKYHPMALTGQSSQVQNTVDCEIKNKKMHHFHPYKHASFTPDISDGMDSRFAALSYHPLTPNPMPRLDPVTRHPICQCAHLDLAAMNAYQIARLPFSHPWFSMPMVPSLSAISMPGDVSHQHRASPHYVYCQCFCCLGSWRASKPNLQFNLLYLDSWLQTLQKKDKFKVLFDMAVALISMDKKTFSPEKSDKKLSPGSLMLDQNTPDLPVKDILEEDAYEVQEDASFSKKLHCHSCNQNKVETSEINLLLSLSFPKKLWKIVESDEFKSISWNDPGDCIIIDEVCFQREILDRRGILRIFDTDSMKSFIRQLNLYGFSKIRKSVTLHYFQGEENRTRILLYHNAYFRRGCPLLIQRMKRRVGIKSNEQLNPISPNLKRRKPAAPKKYISFQDSIQPNDLQTPCLKETINNLPKNSINAGNGKMNHSYPVSTPWPLENGTENSVQNGIYNQQRNPHMDTNATSSICPCFPLTSETGLEPSMGFNRLPSTYQDFVFMNAQFTTLMSFWNPWFSMLMAATSSIPLTETLNQQFTSPGQPCSLCNCCDNTEPSASCDSANSNSAELL